MSARPLTVACVQHACSTDAAGNLAASEAGIRSAAAQGAHLVLLQELHRTQYFCQVEDPALCDLAETVPGPTTDFLAALARELGVVIVGSVFERRLPGVYHNTAVVLERDGALAGRYRKMHIPDDPGYLEKFYFTPGDGPFAPIDTSVGRLGVLVCWDQWYPEAARLMALAGADLLLYPTAIGWDPADDTAEQARQREAWITIQRAHAIANGLPLLACNRFGDEHIAGGPPQGARFWGSSFIAGPQGELLEQAPVDAPAVICTQLDLAHSEQVRRIWPFLRDRRIDAYQDLARRARD